MPIRSLRAAVGALALAAAIATGSPGAHATTFADLTLDQFVDASSRIVEGTVIRTWAEQGDHGVIWTRAEVQVSAVHKGAPVDRLVIDSAGGELGNVRTLVPGQAAFSAGEQVFLFLEERAGRVIPVSKFRGKFTIRRAAGDTRHHAMRWQASEPWSYDHRFLPPPPAPARLYVDDLRRQVAERVAKGWDGREIPGLTRERLERINLPEGGLSR